MRYIDKKDTPVELEDWKSSQGHRAKYSMLPPGIKEILREKLIDEQLGLCCYCGLALTKKNVHIEHFKPQSKFKKLQLDFKNLHASCMGKEIHETSEEELEFCAHSKQDWFDPTLTVSPLDPNCQSYFEFGFDGTISEVEGNLSAKETIKQLGLDRYLPNTLREAGINAVLDQINLDDPNDIDEWIQFLETPNSENRLPSFCFVISYVLKSLK